MRISEKALKHLARRLHENRIYTRGDAFSTCRGDESRSSESCWLHSTCGTLPEEKEIEGPVTWQLHICTLLIRGLPSQGVL